MSPDASSTRTLRVFLASPGGVETERKAVRRLANELSVPFRRYGWQVEILGWEDRGPATGRAQEDINLDVDRCDIFLGIVWDRWGTPTGHHKSGFEEEWKRARARWEGSGSPELWLCFKQLDDPEPAGATGNDQLSQVLAFRKVIERDEVAFHKLFDSPLDLETALRRELTDQLLRRAGVSEEALGNIAIDWESALAHEPVAQLPDGSERERLAGEITGAQPVKAAEILTSLAGELEAIGFDSLADSYRKRAANALIGADRLDEALAIWRQVLLRALDTDHPIDIEFAVRELGEKLPPEQFWETRAWRACVEWPLDVATQDVVPTRRAEPRAVDGRGSRVVS